LSSSVTAQLTDTITYSLRQKPRFFITLASFNTFIDHQYANISGLRLGLNYNQRIRFGVGFFSLANNAVISNINVNDGDSSYYADANLNFGFVSFSAEYFFFNQYPWQCTITPFQLGIGGAKYEYVKEPQHIGTSTKKETIILYQPEISAQYSIFQWLGVGVTTGYRYTLLRSKKATQHLNAPTFAVDVRLFIDEIYKALFSKDEKKE
jgi:hypothetical protein